MFEFHGWITLRDVFTCEMEENDNFDAIADEFRIELEKMDWCNGFHDIRIVNGEYQMIISGFLNHRSQEVDDLFDLYEKISKKAIGSYGLLYIHDDEDKSGNDNNFIVYSIAKGKIQKHIDTYLSPFIGTVEE